MYESVDSEPMANIGSRFFLRSTLSFLFATGVLSLASVLVSIKANDVSKAYISTLSVAINMVAVYHYYEMLKLRVYRPSVDIELQIGSLRHGDWAVTMPLLVMKFYAIARSVGSASEIFTSVEVAALTAFFMVILGMFVRIGLDELSGFHRLDVQSQLAGIVAWIASCICLLLLVVDIGRVITPHSDSSVLFSMLLVWLGYPALTFLSSMWRRNDKVDTLYDPRLSLANDVGYACLDAFAKGCFALYSASAVFGVVFFG